MALIVEDGTGRIDAESYGSVAEADTYHVKFGNTAWAAKTEAEKEVALRKATTHMVTIFRGSWKGRRSILDQALDHPRNDMWRDEYDMVKFDIVAPEVKACCFELALLAVQGMALLPTSQTRTRKSVKVGPIAVTYDGDGPVGSNFVSAVTRLGPLLTGVASGHMVALVRS